MDRWVEKDLDFLWHPYTQMKDYEKYPPLLIEKAEGIKLFDGEGNYYYDTISSWWCNVHGHNHPKIRAAINEQMSKIDHVMFAGFTHRPAIELAERLNGILPEGLRRVFYSDNGSTAVEIGLKMSFQYWRNRGESQRTKFVSFDAAYHGDTIGTMSVGGDSVFNEAFRPLLFDSYKVPTPYCYRCPCGKDEGSCSLECFGFLEELVEKEGGRISGMIFEPLLLGAGGMIMYPADYLRRAEKLCREYGIHLILDEVATGFGRTGEMFASQKAKVTPDIICISKGLTSGTMPFAATVTTEEIYDGFYDDYSKYKTLYHGHTYTANPIGCAAALACLDIFEEEKTMEGVRELVPVFEEKLTRFKELPHAGDVRNVGMVGAVELVKDKGTKEGFDPADRTGFRIYQELLKRKLILRPLGDVLYYFLPLCITEDELDYVMGESFKVLEEFDYE